ncbi:MAG: hypothetical protein HYZ67_04365 [Chlamydiae bacterium]|nr:hypothetical protein [Chlamydiota bacterium]
MSFGRQSHSFPVEVTRVFESFGECYIIFQNERIKVQFAHDSPYRLEPKVFVEEYGLYIDNLTDISCNKLSALFDRFEPKDFVDVYFIHKEKMPLETLIPLAKKKHVGFDEYWLARAFFRVKQIEFLPRMIKPVTQDELKDFFLSYAEKLVD